MPGRARTPSTTGWPTRRRAEHDGGGTPGPGPVPGGAVRLPGRRAPARLRDEQAGLHRQLRPGPVLLVQGPPGTGKSYSTAFAVFARIQGAMLADQDCRVFAGCKTHAATDVLMKDVLQVREKLRDLREADPERFEQVLRRPAAGRADLPGRPARPAAGRGGPPDQGRREGQGASRRTPTCPARPLGRRRRHARRRLRDAQAASTARRHVPARSSATAWCWTRRPR